MGCANRGLSMIRRVLGTEEGARGKRLVKRRMKDNNNKLYREVFTGVGTSHAIGLPSAGFDVRPGGC